MSTAKEVITNCQSVTQFVRVIANHCLDKQCTVELSLIVEQILTITNQLSIISRQSHNTATTCLTSQIHERKCIEIHLGFASMYAASIL